MSVCQEIIKGKPCLGKRKQFNLTVDYWVDEDKQTEGVLLTHHSWCKECGITRERTTRYEEVEE